MEAVGQKTLKSGAGRSTRSRQKTPQRTPSSDAALMGVVNALPPDKLKLLIAEVFQTLASAGRKTVLKAVSDVAGVEVIDPDEGIVVADESAADDIDTDGLMRAAGDMLTSTKVAERLGQTRQNINEMLKAQRILGVRFGSRWRFPAAQFRHHELLPGLPQVLRVMGDIDPWRKLEVLLAPSEPPERRPLDLLRKGDKIAALTIASRNAAEIRVSRGEAAGGTSIHPELDADLEADLRADREADAIRPFTAAH